MKQEIEGTILAWFVFIALVFGDAGTYAQTEPPNDYFTNRIALSGLSNTAQADNTLATREPGDPDVPPYPVSERTLWWSYTSPSKGVLRTHAEGATFGAAWAVYRGADLASLTLAGSQWGPMWLNMAMDDGEQVQIVVDGTFDGAGPLTLQTEFIPVPPNDMFANRVVLTGTNVSVTGTNIGATVETGEPGNPAGQTVWYSWTAPTTGKLSLDTGRSDCVLGVYQGDAVDQLQLVKVWNPMSILVLAGQAYQIQVDGSTEFVLSLNLVPCTTAPNDNFTNAYPIDGKSYPYSEWITLATTEPGEPDHLDGEPCKSLWWWWEAPVNGKLDISTYTTQAAQATNVHFAVYTGSSVDALTLVGKGPGRVVVDVTCRSRYYVAAVVNQDCNGEVDFLASFGANANAVVVPGNLLCDPSFEQQTLPCWNIIGEGAWIEPGSMDGQFYMHIGAASTVSQAFATVPGKLYQTRFAYSGNAYQTGEVVNISWDATLVGQLELAPGEDGTWNWAQYEVWASNSLSTLSFQNEGTNIYGYFFIDAASVVCIDEAPAIVAAPQAASTVVGGAAAFSVDATGTQPLAYEWFFNDMPLPDQTKPDLVLSDVTTNDGGNYWVVVTNAFGAVTSAPVELMVEAPSQPTIVLEPFGDVIPVGAYFSLSVAAVGSLPLSYQWYLEGVPVPDATNRHLVFAPFDATNGGTYTVIVSNSVASVLSLPATLAATTTNQGGGVVIVANQFKTAAGSFEFPVFDVDGRTRLSSADADYVVQLYAGPRIDLLRPVGTLRPFLTGFDSGVFEAEWVALANVQGGSLGFAQLRGWDRSYGLSYEEARALGSKFGRSPVFTVVPGGNVPGFPPLPPANLYGLSSFSLQAGSPEFQVGRIQFVAQQPDGTISWALIGDAGYRYLVEKSTTNFLFQPFLVLTNSTGTATFTDGANLGQAMYRARILE